MPSAVYDHLGSGQYSRLIYGAIIGLALTVALEHEEPDAAVMAGTLVGTGVAVGLTDLYSEFLGAELRTRLRVDRARFREIATNVVAVIFGASFPAIFFALAAAGATETESLGYALGRRRECRPRADDGGVRRRDHPRSRHRGRSVVT